jgi:hypothetical protein
LERAMLSRSLIYGVYKILVGYACMQERWYPVVAEEVRWQIVKETTARRRGANTG